jgi:hypothetical protein
MALTVSNQSVAAIVLGFCVTSWPAKMQSAHFRRKGHNSSHCRTEYIFVAQAGHALTATPLIKRRMGLVVADTGKAVLLSIMTVLKVGVVGADKY